MPPHTEAEIERLVSRLFSKYYPPSSSVFQGSWRFEHAPRRRKDIELRLRQLIAMGCRVRTGWAATSARNFHNHHIFYQEKERRDG